MEDGAKVYPRPWSGCRADGEGLTYTVFKCEFREPFEMVVLFDAVMPEEFYDMMEVHLTLVLVPSQHFTRPKLSWLLTTQIEQQGMRVVSTTKKLMINDVMDDVATVLRDMYERRAINPHYDANMGKGRLMAAVDGVAAWVTAGLVQWSHENNVKCLERQLDLLSAVRSVARQLARFRPAKPHVAELVQLAERLASEVQKELIDRTGTQAELKLNSSSNSDSDSQSDAAV